MTKSFPNESIFDSFTIPLMLNVQNLTKKYNNKPVVDDVSFSLEEGETLVLLGTSGSGKTTTLKMINRLIESDFGTIEINGTDVLNQPIESLRRQIGYVIQSVGLFPHYDVAQNVGLVPSLLGWDRHKTAERTGYLLNLVGLPPEEFKTRMPHGLSGGQRQRVGIARALAADPPIILLDEPFGALDPITRSQMQEEFKNLEAILNKTLVLVTHDVSEAIYLADRICLMDDGKIQQLGRPKELVFSPANEFVKEFFSAGLLQSQMMALRLEDLTPFLKKIPPTQVIGKSVHYMIQNAKLLALSGLDEQEVVNAFFKAKQEIIS